MDESTESIENFLNEICEKVQLTASEENVPPKIVFSYSLKPEEVHGQVIDWIFYFFETVITRKCPYHISSTIAKTVAQQIEASLPIDKETKKLSSAATLYSEAISLLPAVCNSFMEQTNLKETLLVMAPPIFTSSVFSIKNKRRKMEDRHVVHPDLNALMNLKDVPFHSYYAVFDGHCGIDAANYASAQLHINIVQHPAFLTDLPTAIREGYKHTDEKFLIKCRSENLKSGCTAVTALIRETTLYLTWLGDSQAVLVKRAKPVMITSPHKPEREDERERIESLGGHVAHMGIWRVNGVIAVTRAIGDPDHKPFLSSEPEMEIINLDGNEDFLILACDGLWDVVSPEEVTSSLYYNLSDFTADQPLDSIAAKLVHQAKSQGSEDNITAVVIFLRDINSIKEDYSKYSNLPDKIENVDKSYDSLSNAQYVKPTVLELNGASVKKLKNTANVLSSAGFGNQMFAYQYSENFMEGACFQNISMDYSTPDGVQNMYVAPQNMACFAPEATALSELPTPPIDDLAAQQAFVSDQFQELGLNNAKFSQQFFASPNDAPSTDSNMFSTESTELISFENVIDSKIAGTSNSGNVCDITAGKDPNITANEAVGIATCVVSSAIETAVKSLSADAVETVTSPKKLNPYAEPFVMKSFFAAEGNEQSDVTTTSQNILMSDNLINLESAATVVHETHSSNKDLCIEKVSDAIDSKSNLNEVCTDNKELVGNQPFIENNEQSKMKYSELEVQECMVMSPENESTSELSSLTKESLNLSVATEMEKDVKVDAHDAKELFNKIDENSKEAILNINSEHQNLEEVQKTNAYLPSNLVEGENKIPQASPILETIAKNPISLVNMQEELLATSEVTLSDEHVEETHVEAVDLQSVPDGVPEAEGVTEDIDSDSEKDGGWSYMKGNAGSAENSKTEVTENGKAKPLEPSVKIDDSSKGMVNKTKTKNISVDKNKKLEKKIVDVKDKGKVMKPSALNTQSKTNIEKTSRTMPATPRYRKDQAASKVTTSSNATVVVSKTVTSNASSTVTSRTSAALKTTANTNRLSRPITQKTVSSVKTGTVSTVNRTQTLSVKNSNSPSTVPNLKSKTPETKPNVKQLPSISKSPHSIQNKKPATAASPTTRIMSNRTAASVVPSAKPTSKPVESKSKQPISTVKRTVPTLKKLEVKETKDDVNKQISKKNISDGAPKVKATTHISALNKQTLTTSNKSVTNKTTGDSSTKSSLSKKEVPKVSSLKFPKSKSPSVAKAGKVNEKKTPTLQTEPEQKNLSDQINQESNKDTSSEQEKFILEANDKESVLKEQSKVSPVSNSVTVENGSLSECSKEEEPVSHVVECSGENR